MKNALVALTVIVALIGLPMITIKSLNTEIQLVNITSNDRVAARAIINTMEQLNVSYSKQITDSIGSMSLSEGEFEAIIKPSQITYRTEFVITKGLYAAEVQLNNKKRIKAGLSVYGQFFIVDGINGFFEYELPPTETMHTETMPILMEQDYRINRLDDLLSKVEDIKRLQGTIVNLQEFQTGIFVIDIKTNTANGIDEIKRVEMPTNCSFYFIDAIGLKPSTLESFIQKTETELDSQFYDTYTFVFVKNKLAQIIQGTSE